MLIIIQNQKILLQFKRLKYLKEVFHLYHINLKNLKTRNDLKNYLIKNNIDAKVHYPIPVHLQKAAKYLGYKKVTFLFQKKWLILLPLYQCMSSLIKNIFITCKKRSHPFNRKN